MKFVVVLGVLALAFVVNAGVSMNNPFYCYMTDPIRPMTNMHSILTSYEAIRRFNFTTFNPYHSTCRPDRFWYVGRYGGRFPFPDMMEDMIEFAESSIQADIVTNYEAGRTTLCRQDFEALRDWTRPTNFNMPNASLATAAGVEAMQNIARRFQLVIPEVLTPTYDSDRFYFRHTSFERTNASIRAFATGLFGEAAAQNVEYEDVPERDWLLRPFDFCPAFRNQTANYNASEQAFQRGPEIEETVANINRKLGFRGSGQLSFETIWVMWEWCRWELSSTFEFSDSPTGGNSAWCAPFSVADNLVLEYFDDVSHFHFSGYGFVNQRLLQNMHCGLMHDLLEHLDEDEGDIPNTSRIFVTMTQEIQSLLVTLGAFRDTWPMHEHNYAQQQSRHWLTSLISPFGANLAVIRYNCDDEDDDLVFLMNERPILVPGCDQQTGVCKLNVFLQRFPHFRDANCEEFFCSDE